ncbi:hypothetical protein [Paenibacillus puerhi]|uniref:hypothetical protein n=1 Tax=Paenibacillus puerhi TaxID=2692622 RepID=UPI001358CEF3|nr:hypothetical protein [Paenibacillus puerhi]
MKKISTLLLTLILLFTTAISASASEKKENSSTPTKASLEKANKAIEKGITKLNKKLEKANIKEDYIVIEEKVEGTENETIVLEINPQFKDKAKNKEYGENAVQLSNQYNSTDVNVYITYNAWFGAWYMRSAGTFTWGTNSSGTSVISGHAINCSNGAGLFYSSSTAQCTNSPITPSIVDHFHNAKYTYLYGLGMTYNGYISVRLTGTGNYIVNQARFDI